MPNLHPLSGALLLACAGLWNACAPAELPPPLRVEYAGCEQVDFPGPVCSLGKSRRLSLWVPDPEARVEVRAGWLHWSVDGIAGAGGRKFAVEIPGWLPLGATTVRATAGRERWSLQLGASHWPDWSRQAQQLIDEGKSAAARQLLQPHAARGPERGIAYGLLAQCAENEPDQLALLRRAVAAHHTAGRLLDEVNFATTLSLRHIQRSRFGEARQILAGLELPERSPAEAFYARSYYRGLLAQHLGDARAALANLEAAVEQAERVGLEHWRWTAEQILARQYQELGRSREAARRFEALHRTRPPGLADCDWAEMLTNQAWSLLQAGEAGEPRNDPLPLLEAAQRTFASAGCSRQQERRLNFLLNRALACLQSGRPSLARASLAASRELDRFAKPLLKLWSFELEARLELAAGRPEPALRLYDRLDELALSPDDRWRAAYGRARCLRALDRREEALAAFGRAEALLDEQSLQIPVYEGRETFAARHEAATEHYLELLLDTGRPAEALEVARRARSRVLRQLARGDRLAHLSAAEQERRDRALGDFLRQRTALEEGAGADWQLPRDALRAKQAERAALYREMQSALDRAVTFPDGLGAPTAALPPPRPGEVILAYHPLSRGWVGFAAAGRTVTVHRFVPPAGAVPPASWAALLLEPFHSQIAQARTVRVLPYGILREIDFHALPFAGSVLLARHPVVYGLDLPAPAASPEPPGRRVLVVGNPLADLPSADLEARAAAAALRSLRPPWQVEVLERAQASAGPVRRSLPRADLFHYAGHGAFSGFGGWESALLLAGDTQLRLGDLLTLRKAPTWVVLSGCETGRVSADASVEGLNLAHAFLLAGSRAVVAATRPVGDRAAQGLFAQLYQDWSSAPDLAARLQRAQLDWHRRDPTADDWASFRLFEP